MSDQTVRRAPHPLPPSWVESFRPVNRRGGYRPRFDGLDETADDPTPARARRVRQTQRRHT
jgi:hypothetical protein